ncbi:MAG: M23 family metallopeptidase [Oscillospiraceae bacterium]|nr:M23 family metallopeptidase [Oscillospiraceae bacterium]
MSTSHTNVRGVTVRSRKPLAHVAEAARRADFSAPIAPPPAPPAPEPIIDDATRPLGFAERMLRNTALSVAMLLCVLAVQSLNTPGAQSVTGALSDMVTMDLNESLGSLRFVSNLMPESAQVFWNLGAERHLAPSDGEVAHAFSAQEPWLGYGAGEVRASAAGEVMSVAVDAVGLTMVRLRHASGMETLYGDLSETAVREGDWVAAGAVIGASEALTYELRGEGRAMDPAPYLP